MPSAYQASKSLLVGRNAAFRELTTSYRNAETGKSRIVVIEGAAGIGKTFLLESFLNHISCSNIIRLQAIEIESHQDLALIRNPYYKLGSPRPKQFNKVENASIKDNLFTISKYFVSGITQLCSNGPCILAIDDLHWADKRSIDLILLSLRRLSTSKLLAVILTRSTHDLISLDSFRSLKSLASSTTIRLNPYGVREANELHRQIVGTTLEPELVQQAVTITKGSPLYLSRLFGDISSHDSGTISLTPAGLTAKYADLIRKFESLNQSTQMLIALTAVLGMDSSITLLEEIFLQEHLGHDFEQALELALQSQLLTYVPGSEHNSLGFPHFLIRSSILETLDPGTLTNLHTIAASFTSGDRRLLHLIDASPDGNESLRSELTRLAFAAATDYDHPRAAWLFTQSWRLERDKDLKAGLLQLAILSYIIYGDILGASSLGDYLDLDLGSPWNQYLIGCLHLGECRIQEARTFFLSALVQARSIPGYSQVQALTSLALSSIATLECNWNDLVDYAQSALEADTGDPHIEVSSIANKTFSLAFSGNIELARSYIDIEGARLLKFDDSLELQSTRAVLLMWSDNLHEARELLQNLTNRKSFRFSRVPIFMFLAECDLRLGELASAAENIEIALDICFEFNRTLERAIIYSLGTIIYSYLGDFDTAYNYLYACEGTLSTGVLASSRVAYANARYVFERFKSIPSSQSEALSQLQPIFDKYDPGMLIFPTVLGQVSLELNDPERALSLLEPTYQRAGSLGRGWALGWLALVRGRADHQKGHYANADNEFANALKYASKINSKLLEAKILCEWLISRSNRTTHNDTQDLLLKTLDSIESIGAYGLLGRLHDACPTTVGAADPALRANSEIQLTPREVDMLGLVSTGLSNKEIASKLHVSAKSVEYHLSNIYLKFGVHSRAELIAKVLG